MKAEQLFLTRRSELIVTVPLYSFSREIYHHPKSRSIKNGFEVETLFNKLRLTTSKLHGQAPRTYNKIYLNAVKNYDSI